ncbi:MAG: hypothetical protein K0U45_02365 [Alphaproteobacteria bacterium]|nr:hypothetical protein [Alphaproteobacteria bacterium]
MSIYLITLPEQPSDLSFDALKIMKRDNIVIYRGSHITDDMMVHLSRNADFYDMHYLSDKQITQIMHTADEIGKNVLFLSQPTESKYFSLKIRCLKQYETPYYNLDEQQELVAA